MIPLPSDGSVSIAGRSPGLAAETIEAVVTLPTFKRPELLLETLASLKAQMTADCAEAAAILQSPSHPFTHFFR